MNSEVKKTLTELIAGIWAVCFLMALAVSAYELIAGRPVMELVSMILGFVCGGGLASFMAAHIARALDRAVDMDEKSALNHSRKMYIIRTSIVLVAIVLIYYTGMVNLITLLFGLFSLKAGAYLQPVTARLLNTSNFGGRTDNDDFGRK